jgi:hypothetical protein
VLSKVKIIEMAMINTLQLEARKNLFQMSSDVVNYNSNCHSGLSKHLPTTCLDYFVSKTGLARSFENMKRREYVWKLKADLSNIYSSS